MKTIAADIERRDAHDSTRAASPLRRADDAVEVDTSDISIDEVVAMLTDVVEQRLTELGMDTDE